MESIAQIEENCQTGKRWGKTVEKVNETIEVLCDWIQTQLADGKCDASHQVSEMVKALAELVSVSAEPF